MLKRTYKKPETVRSTAERKGINYSKFVSEYAKQTGGNYKELLKDPKVKEMWKSRGKTVKFASQQAQAQTQAPTTQAPTTQAPLTQAVIPNKVSNLKLTTNNVIDNILLGKNVNDTGLERSYLQRVYNFLNSITPTKYYKESSADDYNLEPLAYLFNDHGNVYIDSPFSWEFAVYARNPVKMFPGKRELRLIFNDFNRVFDTDSYRRFTNIKSEGDRSISYTVDEVKENGNLIDLYNEVDTLYKQTNDVNLVWYNDTFYKRKISVINLIIYLYYCSRSKCEKMIYVTDKDFGTNLTTFWKNLDIASIQDLDFNKALDIDNSPNENMDIVNVINYLSGRSYQTNETQVPKQQGAYEEAYQGYTEGYTEGNTEGNTEGIPEGYTEYNEPPSVFTFDPIDANQQQQQQQLFAMQPAEQQYDIATSAYMEAQNYEDKSSETIDELTKERSALEEKIQAQKKEKENIENKYKQDLEKTESDIKEKEDEILKKTKELAQKDNEISKLNQETKTLSAELKNKEKEIDKIKELQKSTQITKKTDEEEKVRITAKKKEYKEQFKTVSKEKEKIEKELNDLKQENKDIQSEKEELKKEKEDIEKEKNKLVKFFEEIDKKIAKKQEELEAKISQLESKKSSLEKELNEEKEKNNEYRNNIKRLEEMISSMEEKNKELPKTLPSKRTKQPAPKRLSESSQVSSPSASSSVSSIRRKEPPARRFKPIQTDDQVDYYDSQFNDQHNFAINIFDDNNIENKLVRIKNAFKEEAENLYYFEAVSNESDERNLIKLGNKKAADIFDAASTVYITLVGPNLENRLRNIGINIVNRSEIKKTVLAESIFLGGSSNRITGGSVFDDVKLFLQYFNISSMEKLPSIAKGKNTYLFRF